MSEPKSETPGGWPMTGQNYTYVPSRETPGVFEPVTIPPDAKRFVFLLKGEIVHQEDDKDIAFTWAAVNGGFYDRMIDQTAQVNKYCKTEPARDHYKESAERAFLDVGEPDVVIGREDLDQSFDTVAAHAERIADKMHADRMAKFAAAAEVEAGCPIAAGYWNSPTGEPASPMIQKTLNDAVRHIEQVTRPPIAKIMESRDVRVQTVVNEWRLGGFASFEEAMVFLAAELLDQLHRTESELVKVTERKI